MALVKRGGGFLHKRDLKRFVNEEIGARFEWNDKELVAKIDREINSIIKVGAKGVEALAKSMVPVGETGNLKKSIRAFKSRYEKTGILDRWAYVEWVIAAGDDTGGVDYAAHVELGRYFKKTNTRVPAIPFIRRPLSIMRKKMRRLMINRLRRILS